MLIHEFQHLHLKKLCHVYVEWLAPKHELFEVDLTLFVDYIQQS